MAKITILGTIHKNLGQCNVAKLVDVLKAVGPEVIFEEIRPADHERFYREAPGQIVEVDAIRVFSELKAVKQVPVDEFEIPIGFKKTVDEIFQYVESNSSEYLSILSKIDQLTYEHGYTFLSSLHHIELRNAADDLIEQLVSNSECDLLKNSLSGWYQQLRRRELIMLDNIYEYCRNNSVNKGVFLVGSGHLSYLAKLIEDRLEIEPSLIDWQIGHRLGN